jgi:hypothetical protein
MDSNEIEIAKAFMDGYVPPTTNEVNERAWKAQIHIAEATKRVAERQLTLLRTQAEIIRDQMTEEQHKINKADYDAESARKLIAYYEEHPDGRH